MGSGGEPVAPAPALAAPYTLGPDTHIIIDANSYYAAWTYPGIQEIGALKQLITSAGATVSNTAIPGQTWTNMRVNNEDVIAAFKPGKRNILICGETRNWVATHGGCTVDDVAMEASLYIATARAAVQARYGQDFDRVVLCGTIPNSTFLDEPWKNDIDWVHPVGVAREAFAEAIADALKQLEA